MWSLRIFILLIPRKFSFARSCSILSSWGLPGHAQIVTQKRRLKRPPMQISDFFFFPLQNSIFSRIPSLKFWLLQPLQTSISVCSIQFHFSSGNCLQLGIIGFSHLSSFKNHNPWLLLDFVWKKVIFSVVSWFELFWGAQFLTCYSLTKQNWF